MADQIHAPVDGVQRALCQPVADRAVADSGRAQLGTADDAVLPGCEPGDAAIAAGLHNGPLGALLLARGPGCTAIRPNCDLGLEGCSRVTFYMAAAHRPSLAGMLRR